MAEASDDSTGRIREGKAEVLPNRANAARTDGRDDVFYNPAQVFNRDLSVVVLSVFAKIREAELWEKFEKRKKRCEQGGDPGGREPKTLDPPKSGLHILEALAATGLRSIRYAKELGSRVRRILANDLDPVAVNHIQQNVVHNSIPEGVIDVNCGCAAQFMYMHRCRGPGGKGNEAFDVIDVDPYGTAAPFLDAAVQAVADGGLLCITSTDMPVLGGNHPETCFTRYGGGCLKSCYVHEMSLRLLMNAIQSSATKYGRYAQPMVCCSIDFYVRLFVRVFDSALKAKMHASETGLVYQCCQCESFFVQKLGDHSVEGNSTKFKPPKSTIPGDVCPECKGRFKIGGPFYTGPLYDQSFVNLCLEACDQERQKELDGVVSWKKVTGLFTAISEEHAEIPLHYKVSSLCRGLKLAPIPLKLFKGTLINLGYKASHFHREPEAIKTDAPNEVVFDLMRVWAEEHPPKNKPCPAIFEKAVSLKRPVEWHCSEDEPQVKKVAKFLPNPEANWGPKPRAKSVKPEAPDENATKEQVTHEVQKEAKEETNKEAK
eukprot:gnl/MRDRNA2_/MRDRNA2_93774_c0_seq1.p1 gnl/MRDRNA2_/MRDRNA2_93774_c0~~gnl/MRDRNA2_/MRDRNA2_93774_c0_seq1.p1  ORF type:complete len:545 (-),score=122.60 gnl/MRDRNA2_/MRDRNA2_93774_c0_seq1:103-1737(-)